MLHDYFITILLHHVPKDQINTLEMLTC